MSSEFDNDVQLAGYEDVAELAAGLLAKAGGGALCLYVDGVPVLDLWGGHQDPSSQAPWKRDTMSMSWSTTKGVTSTVMHLLAERKLLDYDQLVSHYWPEFGVNGKEQTTIRHLLSMEAGLYDIRHLLDKPTLMLDHEAMAKLLASASPIHEPGAKNGYHAMTYGWLVGELVRRVTGGTLGDFVRSEIADPLGLDGCYIGVPSEELGRVAAFPKMPPEKAVVRAVAKTLNPITSLFGLSLSRYAAAFFPLGGHEVIPTSEFLQAEVASINGVFTARSLAKLYAALGSDDGVDGVRLWSPATRRAAIEEQNTARDQVVPIKVGWKLGYHQPFPKKKTSSRSFGFYGAFGSGAFADPDRGLAVGFVVQEAKGLPLTKLVGPILAAVDTARSGSK